MTDSPSLATELDGICHDLLYIIAGMAKALALYAPSVGQDLKADADSLFRRWTEVRASLQAPQSWGIDMAAPGADRAVGMVAEAVGAERLRCMAIAYRKANHAFDDCECLGFEDPETGVRECSLETRGQDCLCELKREVAEEIGKAIEEGTTHG